jgi:sulfoxide reductase heme-binding subunit YedZ
VITWIVLRAAGVAAYVLLFGSVAWGLVSTTTLFGRRVAKATAVSIHQFLSTVAVVMLGVHLGGLFLDRFQPFGALDILVPLRSTYRSIAVAFGIVAMYCMLAVLVSSWLRKRVGTTWWRRLHLLTVPAFLLAMLHGITAGSDASRPWMWWLYVVTGVVTVFLVLVRGLTAQARPARAARETTTGARRVSGRPVGGPVPPIGHRRPSPGAGSGGDHGVRERVPVDVGAAP